MRCYKIECREGVIFCLYLDPLLLALPKGFTSLTSTLILYLFTVIDRTTRWPEAVLLASINAGDCAAALL